MAMRTGSRGSITERSLPLTLSDSVTQSKSMRFSVHTGSTSTCSKPCSSVSTKTRWRCAKGARQLSGLDHYAPNRHDTGSTTARSVDEVALIRDTISHYAPVLIAPLSIQIRRAGVQKKSAIGLVRRFNSSASAFFARSRSMRQMDMLSDRLRKRQAVYFIKDLGLRYMACRETEH